METPKYLEYADHVEDNTYYFSPEQKKDVQDYYDAIKDLDEYKNSELLTELKSALKYAKEHTWTTQQAKNEIKYHKEEITTNGKTETINVIDGKTAIGDSDLYDKDQLAQVGNDDFYKIDGKFIAVSEYNKKMGINTEINDTPVVGGEIIKIIENGEPTEAFKNNNKKKCKNGVCPPPETITATQNDNTKKLWNPEVTQTKIEINNSTTPIDITSQSQFQKTLTQNEFTILEFYAKEGCGYCDLLEPTIIATAEELEGKTNVIKVDSWDSNTKHIADYIYNKNPEYNFEGSVPHIVIIDKNGQIQTEVDNKSPSGIQKALSNYMS